MIGIVNTSTGSAKSVKVQTDGKIVVTGGTDYNFITIRTNYTLKT